ncbi:MAG: hypothetical protein GXP48_11365 [Acidobacteria bacterium]|nr:hypothetical protein [Acidobacteriota bacterium]
MPRTIHIALKKTGKALIQALPILAGVLTLVSLAVANIPKTWYARLFTNTPLDPVIGAAAGSVAAGNPLTSYIIGGELLRRGVSLLAVIAFLMAWVTVGFVQLPAEAMFLGRRFAVTRNVTAFVLAIVVAMLSVLTMRLVGITPRITP